MKSVGALGGSWFAGTDLRSGGEAPRNEHYAPAPTPCVKRQHGAAAVEFALVFPVLMALLYGLITAGDMLVTQSAVSRAAQAGALGVALLPPNATDFAPIRNEVIESLATSSVVSGDLASRRSWLAANTTLVTVVPGVTCPTPGGTCLRVEVRLPYRSSDRTRVFAPIQLPGMGSTSAWFPSELYAVATVSR